MDKETTEKKPRRRSVKAAKPKEEQKAELQPVQPAVKAEKTIAAPAQKKVAPLFFGTGRRKTACAQVRLFPGNGKIILNGRDFRQYFCNRHRLVSEILRPLEALKIGDKYDVVVVVKGGGVPSQAEALKMGLGRALLALNPEAKKTLRQGGFLSRDARMKERKKYGHKRARKSFQYTKR